MWFPNPLSKSELVSSHPLEEPRNSHKHGYPEVKNWLISQFIIDKIIPLVGTQPYPLSEIQLMIGTICWVRPRKIIEWGTHIGVAARIFSETLSYFNIVGKIYSIDLPDYQDHIEHPHGERGRLVRDCQNVQLIQGDGLIEACKVIGDSKGVGTLLFLDGDHSYTSVKRELMTIGRRYPKSAIIAHDTFNQVADSHYNVGPYLAVTEFLSKYPSRYYQLNTALGLPGMTVLIPKN